MFHSVEEGTKYYLFIQNSSTKPTFGETNEELEENSTYTLNANDEKKIVQDMNKYISYNGDIYIWIVEGKTDGTNKEVLSGKKIEKPK